MDLKSGLPYWLARHGMPYEYPTLRKDIKTDVLILGGGITGALVAHQLLKKGVESIIIDGRTIGLGSTCASTALLQYEIDTPLHELQHKVGFENAVLAYRYCALSIDMLKEIAASIHFDAFEPRKSLYYAAKKSDTTFLSNEFNIRKDNGFDVEWLHEEAIKERYGFSSAAAILSSKAAQTNAYLFAHDLHQHAISKGIAVYDRTMAVKISHHKSGVELITNKGFRVKAGTLIYANGYEAVKYIDKKIVDLSSTYAICSEQLSADEMPALKDTLLWNTADPYLYLRTTPDNRLLIGGRDEPFYNPTRRDALLPSKAKQLKKDAEKLFKGFTCNEEFSWTGTFGSTKDGLPYIGSWKKLPRSYFALGFGGNGITFSVVAAEIIAAAISGKPSVFRNIFNFDR